MDERRTHVIAMYDRHPISAEQILARLTRQRGTLDGLTPPDLFGHDQDHYGGLDVNRVIAERAGLRAGDEVVDFCAGLGGPARWFAHTCGVTVTGIELNAQRVEGARALNAMVGLAERVHMIEGDVTATPLDDECADVVISQEAFLHVPDKGAAISEAARLLKSGGRLVFSDWVRHTAISDADTDILWRGLGAQTLQSIASYEALIDAAGLERRSLEDLTAGWAGILAERYRMYTALVVEREEAGLPPGDPLFHEAYERLVSLVGGGDLGGARFTAWKAQ